jgi:hypothetical protein
VGHVIGQTFQRMNWWQRVITVILAAIIILDFGADLGDCGCSDPDIVQTR